MFCCFIEFESLAICITWTSNGWCKSNHAKLVKRSHCYILFHYFIEFECLAICITCTANDWLNCNHQTKLLKRAIIISFCLIDFREFVSHNMGVCSCTYIKCTKYVKRVQFQGFFVSFCLTVFYNFRRQLTKDEFNCNHVTSIKK